MRSASGPAALKSPMPVCTEWATSPVAASMVACVAATATQRPRAQSASWRSVVGVVCVGDVTAPDFGDRIVKTAVDAFGGCHVVVNNAGYTWDSVIQKMSDEQWHEVVRTNLDGAFFCTRSVLPSMIKNRSGSVIFIGSVSPFLGVPGQANYAATKAGVMGLARSLSSEVASRGITVNVIAPGLIDTDMTMELGDGRDALLSRVPLGRIGNVSDVAGCAFFLASDESRYITGTVIRVDGGLAMGW